MDLPEDLIMPYNEQIVNFVGERIDTHDYVDLRIRLGTDRDSKEMWVSYLLMEANISLMY